MQKLDKVRDELFNVVCDVNALTLTLEDKAPMITLKYTISGAEKTPMTERATYNKTDKIWSVVFTFDVALADDDTYNVFKNNSTTALTKDSDYTASKTDGNKKLTITEVLANQQVN